MLKSPVRIVLVRSAEVNVKSLQGTGKYKALGLSTFSLLHQNGELSSGRVFVRKISEKMG